MRNFKKWYSQALCLAASAISVIAVLASQVPCAGQYYQPRVPNALRK